MKNKSIITVVFCLFFVFNTQGQTNPQQINTTEFDNLLFMQSSSVVLSDVSSIAQLGNNNSAILSQTDAGGLLPNASNSMQQGSNNLADITQKGNGNVLFSFQMGVMADELSNGNIGNSQLDIALQNMMSFIINPSSSAFTIGSQTNDIDYIAAEGNKMTITQNGTNNGIMAVQQGSNNTLSAEQTGNNNYLLALQIGSNNTIEDYKQENTSDQILYDKIIQTGDFLTLKSDVASTTGAGNTFIQTGSNLSFEINSDLLNSPGGVQVNQAGNNMKVVISQSYFSFPLGH